MKSLIEMLQADVFSYLTKEDIANLFEGDNRIIWQESGFYGTDKAENSVKKVIEVLEKANYIVIDSSISNDIEEGYEGYCYVEFFKLTNSNRLKDSIVLNLTPHNLNLQLADGSIHKLPQTANVVQRVEVSYSPLDDICGIPLAKLNSSELVVRKDITNLISDVDKIAKQMRVNLVCVVSSLVLEAMSEFTAKEFYNIHNVIYVAPNEYVRDDKGQIIAIKSFKTKYDGRKEK